MAVEPPILIPFVPNAEKLADSSMAEIGNFSPNGSIPARATLMPALKHSPPNLSEIERTLSTDRLQLNQASVGGNRKLAIQLYEHLKLLVDLLYPVQRGLEVSPRNTIHAHSSRLATVGRSGGTQ